MDHFYTEAELVEIFTKAAPCVGWPEWAIDCDNRIIRFTEYGRYTAFGWQVDHIRPVALGGIDAMTNLRPRHWQGNSFAGGLLGGLLG
ncbi:MAG TPA: HNH endonuclease signature motif containing protein [Stellaceae bacterium]|nr:HNH endonuclease signature motif containing protein [Stellaceae bacterium]